MDADPFYADPDTFNSRPHKEVDEHMDALTGELEAFNSRPHKEVDCLCSTSHKYRFLSIHDLTRRSTMREIDVAPFCSAFNSRPHKEVDRWGKC